MLEAVKHTGSGLQYAAPEFKTVREFMAHSSHSSMQVATNIICFVEVARGRGNVSEFDFAEVVSVDQINGKASESVCPDAGPFFDCVSGKASEVFC